MHPITAAMRGAALLVILMLTFNSHSVGASIQNKQVQYDGIDSLYLFQTANNTLLVTWSLLIPSEAVRGYRLTWNDGEVDEQTHVSETEATIAFPSNLDCHDELTLMVTALDDNNFPTGASLKEKLVWQDVVTDVILTPEENRISASWSIKCPSKELTDIIVIWEEVTHSHEVSCHYPGTARNTVVAVSCTNEDQILQSCKTYSVIIEPLDSSQAFVGIAGKMISYTLEEGLGSKSVEMIELTETSSRSATLLWRGPNPECPGSNYAVTYTETRLGDGQIHKGQANVAKWSKWTHQNTNGPITANEHPSDNGKVMGHVDNLRPYSEYEFCVAAGAAVANLMCKTVRTLEELIIATEKRPPNIIHVMWDKASGTNMSYDEFNISWNQDSKFIDSRTTTKMSYTIEGIEPCVNHTIVVTAIKNGTEKNVEARKTVILENGCMHNTSTKSTTKISSTTTTTPIATDSTSNYPGGSEATKQYPTEEKCSVKPPEPGKPFPWEPVAFASGVLAGVIITAVVGWKCLKKTKIPIDDYRLQLRKKIATKLQQLGNSTTLQFEFDLLAIESYDGTTDAGRRRENADKNLFSDILPFDNHRVKLARRAPGQTDYISASFIKNPDDEGSKFIAVQGPIEGTSTDFWWMVWEQNVRIVVMLESCSRYWPSTLQEPAAFDPFLIQIEEEINRPIYGMRKLKLTKNGHAKTVAQFRLEDYLEFRATKSEENVIEFLKIVRSRATTCPGTFVVHCRNGTGKTGAFIGLWQLQLAVEKRLPNVDVKQTVLAMRRYRRMLVENQEQYLFLHSCFSVYLKQISCGSDEHQNESQRQTEDLASENEAEGSASVEIYGEGLGPSAQQSGPPEAVQLLNEGELGQEPIVDNSYYYPNITDEVKKQILKAETQPLYVKTTLTSR